MTNSLYTEALADAKAVREAAEARAKQQLIEAMSPDIKLMVEKAILDEEIDEEVTEQIEEQSEEEADRAPRSSLVLRDGTRASKNTLSDAGFHEPAAADRPLRRVSACAD